MRRILMSVMLTLAVLAGCAPTDDLSADENGESAAELGSSWRPLVGAWDGGSVFAGIVFTGDVDGRGHHYFADRVVYCVRAPCNPVREEGWFSATSQRIYLHNGGTTEAFIYSRRGDSLSLRRVGSTAGISDTYTRVPSYCSSAPDCSEQGLAQPRCIGAWNCTSANRCAYHCGAPGGEGWPCGPYPGGSCRSPYVCNADPTRPGASGTCVTATGPRCGTRTCAAGMVCCNPLMGICTPPGGVCIF